MSRKLDIASAIAVALTLGFTLVSADGSGAAAEARNPVSARQAILPQGAAASAAAGTPDNILPASYPELAAPRVNPRDEMPPPPVTEADDADSLAELVSEQSAAVEPSRELECLAGAIYFEAKSETLEGQLAVGRVVVNRARSGRFPASYCGVVYQPSQFSFIRGNAMPSFNRSSTAWQRAVALAQIADEGSWTSQAEGALYFHAARVSPGWRMKRVARIDNHVFYR
ncbi:cell wall hydrolase [Novosphingobium flavum]|uniref:Cell wall hydrolase n=1 Tax=Novosphingobium flavum TaxID=1778672 RepID=A0A7X1FPD6_9SPHN|nr:cell wall hydrolase [Novosphingobium flavum]MBC2664555.1 cell wall hydrolase [Novosphingobium flavum]